MNNFLLPLGVLAALTILASCGRPMAKFSYQGADQTAPANIQFNNESKKAKAYEWTFGDGNFSNAESPEHKYSASGNYLVTLKAQKGKKQSIMEERIVIAAPERCLVEIQTDFGRMVVWLYDATPKHRDNFLKLAEQGYFNDLIFHRVINGFMVQGGDPNSRNAKPSQQLGSGGPGYTVPAEFVDSLIHKKGALAAARTGDQVNPEKASSGSQFYIVHGRPVGEDDLNMIESRKGFRYSKAQRDTYLAQGGTPFLDRDYTVFGEIVEGLEIIDKIANVPTQPGDRPVEDVRMKIRAIQ
jgi:cyclophilin family peptidyl-prolyl cis-trans isomerase